MYSQLGGSLRVEQVTVSVRGLSPDLAGLRLVQLSDFHFDGLRLSEQLLGEAIQASNAAAPDLVLLTGDYVTDDPEPIAGLIEPLKTLRSRAGILAVLGNHDLVYDHSRAVVTQALEQASVQVLWNQVVYPLGAGLPVVGLADFWSPAFREALPVVEHLPPEVPRLVLSHNPDSAAVLRRWRVDLQVSGHTHGGQVVIPGLGPLPARTKDWLKQIPRGIRRRIPSPLFNQNCDHVTHHWEWASGLHAVGDNWLYVNRGLGTYFPGRLFCPPEVTVITLRPAG